jgi:hypothetical protein
MNVDLAEERILQLVDKFSAEEAEARAWAKRTEAFGMLAKIGGFITRPKDEEFEVVYRERRLQPFWRLSTHTRYAYERKREHRVKLGPEVQSVAIGEQKLAILGREVVIPVVDTCLEESRREWFFDGISKAPAPTLKSYLTADVRHVTADELNAQTAGVTAGHAQTVVVPPQARASALQRDVLAQIMPKIEADKILEEKVELDAIELYYRPVYAYRYKWQNKEAVVEFDAITGEAKAGGTTFEFYVGKLVDPNFLLDIGVETASLFLPGMNIAKMVVKRGREIVSAKKS